MIIVGWKFSSRPIFRLRCPVYGISSPPWYPCTAKSRNNRRSPYSTKIRCSREPVSLGTAAAKVGTCKARHFASVLWRYTTTELPYGQSELNWNKRVAQCYRTETHSPCSHEAKTQRLVYRCVYSAKLKRGIWQVARH